MLETTHKSPSLWKENMEKSSRGNSIVRSCSAPSVSPELWVVHLKLFCFPWFVSSWLRSFQFHYSLHSTPIYDLEHVFIKAVKLGVLKRQRGVSMEAAFSQFLKQNPRLSRYNFPRKHTKNHMQKSYPSLLLSSLNSQYYSVSWWLCHWGNTKVSIQISLLSWVSGMSQAFLWIHNSLFSPPFQISN